MAAIVTAVAYMGSLLAHELAHSLVASRAAEDSVPHGALEDLVVMPDVDQVDGWLVGYGDHWLMGTRPGGSRSRASKKRRPGRGYAG